MLLFFLGKDTAARCFRCFKKVPGAFAANPPLLLLLLQKKTKGTYRVSRFGCFGTFFAVFGGHFSWRSAVSQRFCSPVKKARGTTRPWFPIGLRIKKDTYIGAEVPFYPKTRF